ncbi:MAG: photosynthetic complex assembly protein PuhC [Proteobacteria bacterium]|nr:photosynthetic complex assembly protein PuhC [Pseudomonadota bacterium]
MSAARQADSFPRFPLFGAGALIALTIAAAAFAPVERLVPQTRPVAERMLRFEDQPDGGVAVIDASTKRKIAVFAPGTNGFVRATLRGFARERRRDDGGPAAPFRLTRWADGRLTLADPVTGRHAELEAFGIDNERPFAQLLTAGEPR